MGSVAFIYPQNISIFELLALLNIPFNENTSVLKQSYSLEKMHCIIFLNQLSGPLIILIRLPILLRTNCFDGQTAHREIPYHNYKHPDESMTPFTGDTSHVLIQ